MANTKKDERRKRAAERLKIQLKTGKKTAKKSWKEQVALEEKDVKRINKELEILQAII